MRRCLGVFALFALASAATAQSLSGLWDATIFVKGLEIPFRMEFAGDSGDVTGSFLNGEEKVTSTQGRFEGRVLRLSFPYYGSQLEATLTDGALEGNYNRGVRGVYPFHAKRFKPPPVISDAVPPVGGLWEIQTKSAKGELAWRLILRQSGPEVSGAILRVDGDTGTLSDHYQRGKFMLSHFSGARPTLLEITPAADGSLRLSLNGGDKLTALRSAAARAKGLPEPPDPSRFTSVKDPTEPFRFRFPDLNGRIVSESDPRFRGKVVIVSITGSWCPNCHDEAPFFAELYRKYRDRGLEIVALSFEEPEEQKDPQRLRAFIQRYGIEYPVLIAGEPSEAEAKLPQAVNFVAFPTAFFLGRDGRVRSVHAGFASSATGEAHRHLKEETVALIERLLD